MDRAYKMIYADHAKAGQAARKHLASMQAELYDSAMRALVPKPGRGPTKETMDGGWFRCELIGRTASGKELRGKIAGRGDPGNRATTIFVCEAAQIGRAHV